MKKLLSVFMLFAVCSAANAVPNVMDALYNANVGYVMPSQVERAQEVYEQELSTQTAGCVIREDTCDNDDEYLTIPGRRGCFVCQKGKCITGDVVVATNARLDKKSYKNHIFLCQLGWNDRWVPEQLRTCPEKYLVLRNDMNAVEKIINPNTGETVFNDNDAQVISGATPCIGYACMDGYTELNGRCVDNALIAAQANCEDTGGVYNNGICSCNGANMRASGDGKSCECINDNYEYDEDARQCKETEDSIQARKDADAAKAAQEKQAACTQSGGAWSNNACACDKNKNLKTENNICVCISDDFERDALNNCVKTNLAQQRERCAAAGNDVAYWENNSCRCRNVDMTWQNDRCVINPNKAICDNMVDAKWLGGRCVCNDSDYVYNNGKCVKTDDAVAREAAAKLTADQNASRGKITTLSTTLKEMQEGFKVTVWRNEDGTFNTTRLASDSIAAVVLGTTGGLVTSHVVKKNQVNKGFDDIQCTVGGQSVAGWGDEFRVGIQ